MARSTWHRATALVLASHEYRPRQRFRVLPALILPRKAGQPDQATSGKARPQFRLRVDEFRVMRIVRVGSLASRRADRTAPRKISSTQARSLLYYSPQKSRQLSGCGGPVSTTAFVISKWSYVFVNVSVDSRQHCPLVAKAPSNRSGETSGTWKLMKSGSPQHVPCALGQVGQLRTRDVQRVTTGANPSSEDNPKNLRLD